MSVPRVRFVHERLSRAVWVAVLAACGGDDGPAAEDGTTAATSTDSSTTATTDLPTTTATATDTDMDTTGSETDTASTGGPAECGNGVVEDGEVCDDGNKMADDGCESDCTVTSGHPIWTVIHDGPAHGYDAAVGIAIAPDGTLVVAGWQTVAGELNNVWLRKLDPSAGSEIWTYSEDLAAGRRDQAWGVAVDEDGTIVVVGVVSLDADDDDAWIGTFDAAGAPGWSKTWAGNDGLVDSASAVAIDSNGDIVVVGSTRTMSSGTDGLVWKLDAAGNVLWTVFHDGPASDDDGLSGVAIGPMDAIFVAGYESPDTSSTDMWLSERDPSNGALVWERSIDGGIDEDDHLQELAVGAEGALFVAGLIRDGQTSNADFYLAQYDKQGGELWVTTWNGAQFDFDQGRGLALGPGGDVFATGVSVYIGQQQNAVTGRWDPDGNEVWVDGHNGPAGLDDRGDAVAVDAAGFVYVVGMEATLGQDRNAWIRKYAP